MIKNPQLSAEHRAGGALAYRSFINSKQGKYESALRDVTEAIRLYPTHISAYIARCSLNVYKGEYTAALADCARAHEVNGNNSFSLAVRAATFYFLGD
jgi:tetratricopeptide (TPR) repeat protein